MGSTKDSSTQHSNGPSTTQASSRRSANRWAITFLVFLILMAATMGLLAFFILEKQETRLAEEQFEGIAERALVGAVQSTRRKRLGGVSLASVAAFAAPTASEWPFVTVPGFEKIAQNLIDTTSQADTGFVPFVDPSDLPAFEEFARKYFETSPFPNGTGWSSFGFGVWRPDFENATNSPDKRFHVVDGSTPYPSQNDFVAPILHHSLGAHRLLMLNVRSETFRGEATDKMIACAKERNTSGTEVGLPIQCDVLTDIRYVPGGRVGRPLSVVMHPIFPANDETELKGFIGSSIIWDDVLRDSFNDEVEGVDCILKNERQAFSYRINKGQPTFAGIGDLHDTSYSSGDFFNVYSTRNPWIACMGVVVVMILTSVLFVLYNNLMRREFHAEQALLQAKRQFMRYISHEVRTPLNATCTGLTLLTEEVEGYLGAAHPKTDSNTEKAAQYWLELVKDIHSSALSSVDVLNDVLQYDKIELGKLNLERTVWSPWEVIRDTVAEFNLPTQTKRINFVVDCIPETSSQDILAVADQVRITQCVRNLISNAIKFTPEGGKVSVRALWQPESCEPEQIQLEAASSSKTLCRQNGYLELSVADSGAGMTREQVDKLFQAGVQFDANKLQSGQGSGLGLYISKGIIEQHEGTLTVASEGLERGSTFTLTLPLYDVPNSARNVSTSRESATEQSESPDPSYSKQASELPSLRILVVDDAISNRKLLSRLLEKRGHVCDQAINGKEAVKLALKAMDDDQPYQSILMDYEMPVMDGPSAAQELRRKGCDSFIIGVTGNLLLEDVEYFKHCGADGVLGKPVNILDLQMMWIEYGIFGKQTADE